MLKSYSEPKKYQDTTRSMNPITYIKGSHLKSVMHKRGQEEGKAVAIILLIIALFMVLYILFVPPEERARVLGETTDDETDTGTGVKEKVGKELVTDSPGLLSPDVEFGTTHNIPAINLFVKTEPKFSTLASELLVKRAVFSSTSPVLKFPFDTSADVEKVLFTFSMKEAVGTLEILLNGQTVFTEETQTLGPRIVELPSTFLKKNNVLEFSVSNPGVIFWKTNQFILQNIVLKQEFSLVNAKEVRTINLAPQEYTTLEKADLEYVLYCNKEPTKGVTYMQILVNSKNLLSRQLPCISKQETLEVPLNLFQPGINSLTFALDDGDFSLYDMKLSTQSEEQGQPEYSFTLEKDTYESIIKGKKKVELRMYFEGTKQQKAARINFNDASLFMKTTDTKFTIDISPYIIQGTNFVVIKPSNTFSMTGLKVLLI